MKKTLFYIAIGIYVLIMIIPSILGTIIGGITASASLTDRFIKGYSLGKYYKENDALNEVRKDI